MRILRQLLAVVLSWALLASAQGNSWDKVRYNGGTIQTKVDPKDWDNRLTVTSNIITLELKDKQKLEIPCKAVTGLSYGQEAHRRVGTMVALGILVAPLALFGLFHKTRLHFIGIEYKTPDGKGAGLLLQGDKSNYRAILMALRGATGAPVAVSEKDREFVPTGIQTTVVKEPEGEETAQPAEKAAEAATVGTVQVATVPDGAEVYADGEFVGNAPATLKLSAGKHTVKVTLVGYKEWSRAISVSAGSALKLAATLEKPGWWEPQQTGTQQINPPQNLAPERQLPSTPSASANQSSPKRVANDQEQAHELARIGLGRTRDDVNGVVIHEVIPGGPAERAGLREGDTITELDDKPAKSRQAIASEVASRKPGSKVRVSYIRSAWTFLATVTVGDGVKP